MGNTFRVPLFDNAIARAAWQVVALCQGRRAPKDVVHLDRGTIGRSIDFDQVRAYLKRVAAQPGYAHVATLKSDIERELLRLEEKQAKRALRRNPWDEPQMGPDPREAASWQVGKTLAPIHHVAEEADAITTAAARARYPLNGPTKYVVLYSDSDKQATYAYVPVSKLHQACYEPSLKLAELGTFLQSVAPNTKLRAAVQIMAGEATEMLWIKDGDAHVGYVTAEHLTQAGLTTLFPLPRLCSI